MAKGLVEVSDTFIVPCSGRLDNVRFQTDSRIEENIRLKEVIQLINSYGVSFSHYVESTRIGRIAVYSFDAEEGRICIRLKKFKKKKLRKIKDKTQQEAVRFA